LSLWVDSGFLIVYISKKICLTVSGRPGRSGTGKSTEDFSLLTQLQWRTVFPEMQGRDINERVFNRQRVYGTGQRQIHVICNRGGLPGLYGRITNDRENSADAAMQPVQRGQTGSCAFDGEQ
jgi:hypothetical protein